MNFLQRTPFFRLLLPLIAGIIAYQLITIDHWLLIGAVATSFFAIFFHYKFLNINIRYKFRWIFGLGIYIMLFGFGYLISTHFEQKNEFQSLNKEGIYEIELSENPVIKDKSVLCRVKTLQYFDTISIPTCIKGKAIIYFQKDSASINLKSGDKLLLFTLFKKPDGAINPDGFNYASYLKRQGIGATVYVSSDKWKRLGSNDKFSIFRTAEKLQEKLLNIYKKFGINGDEFAVLAALTLGSKDALHPELRQNYTTSGGMHILAVSGLHVGIMFLVLNFLMSFMNKNQYLKVLKAVLIVILLWGYAFITGLPPSVIRATIMFSFVAIGNSLKYKPQIYNTISLSAFLMLLINPNYIFDVGFQLSFSAVVGIVYFQPKFSKLLYFKNKLLKSVWDLTSVSLAAQIATFPFSIFYFHQFPNYFLLTNLIAIPFASIIIYLAVILFATSSISIISSAIAFILKAALISLNFSIHQIHNIPYAVTFYSFSFLQFIFIIISIIFFTHYFYSKNFNAISTALLLVFGVLVIEVHKTYSTLHETKLIVYADSKSTNIDFINGKNHKFYSTDYTTYNRVAGNYLLNHRIVGDSEIHNSPFYNSGFINFSRKRILILTSDFLNRKYTQQALELDYLIIGNKLKPRFDELLKCIHPQKVIVDKTVSVWYTENIRKTCIEKNIQFYSLAENGAYILTFIK